MRALVIPETVGTDRFFPNPKPEPERGEVPGPVARGLGFVFVFFQKHFFRFRRRERRERRRLSRASYFHHRPGFEHVVQNLEVLVEVVRVGEESQHLLGRGVRARDAHDAVNALAGELEHIRPVRTGRVRPGLVLEHLEKGSHDAALRHVQLHHVAELQLGGGGDGGLREEGGGNAVRARARDGIAKDRKRRIQRIIDLAARGAGVDMRRADFAESCTSMRWQRRGG